MSDRWCTSDGWDVEVIRMTATPDRHDGESLRVSHHGFHVAYARSVAELERWVELTALEEALATPVQCLEAQVVPRAHVHRQARSHVQPAPPDGAAMGFIKDSKQNTAAQHAQRAMAEGHAVMLYRFNVPATSSGFSGPVSGAAEVIEGIERHGWRLAQMAYDEAQSKNGALMLLFRRA